MTRNQFIISILLFIANVSFGTPDDWKTIIDQRLSLYGHRNWIVVADSAYPKQSAPGIETIDTGSEQLEVLHYLLQKLEEVEHVQPKIMLDAELAFVSEQASPGVNAYRAQIGHLFEDSEVNQLPHDEIIVKLDKASKLFNILLLKTTLKIPYTSVFFELDCGYWDETREKQLRASILSQK